MLLQGIKNLGFRVFRRLGSRGLGFSGLCGLSFRVSGFSDFALVQGLRSFGGGVVEICSVRALYLVFASTLNPKP